MQDEKRLVDLEIKIAHAEQTIEDLSEGIYRQQLQIDKLDSAIQLLTKKLQSGTSGELDIGPANEKPPHY
ncbi:MAG: hypothetical protein K0R29_1151 [Pseudobdellovibrio sp.]|jgi:SlyX protein|nr:hypothetical protein [Pseudobdellovibrio sp.]